MMKKIVLTASFIIAISAGVFFSVRHNNQSVTVSDLQKANIEVLTLDEYANACVTKKGYICRTSPYNAYKDAIPYTE